MPVTEFLARAIRPAIQSQFRVQEQWLYEGSQNRKQKSRHPFSDIAVSPFLPPLNAINLCAAHAPMQYCGNRTCFHLLLKCLIISLEIHQQTKGPRLCQRYTACAICCRQSKWHTLNLSLILHPSNPRKTGSRGVFDYKHVGFMNSSFGVSHSLFFMPITNLNLHEYVFVGESALNLNM